MTELEGFEAVEVEIPTGDHALTGDLTTPPDAKGFVVFAHGSGSSRRSPRNRFVAETFQQAGLATLLFDLLTPDEGDDRDNVFDIPLLATRLEDAVHWLHNRVENGARIGLFGSSTGAAAALVAAADLPDEVGAVVSRGGRVDLASDRLGEVRAPTMLLVGSKDEKVLELNRRAAEDLTCEHSVEVVPLAGHLFEEPGTLDAVAARATSWFKSHLG